jgi:hypothetical protein
MPITQSRLFSLIEAAERYIRRDESIRNTISEIYSRVTIGDIDPRIAWDYLNAQLIATRDYDATAKMYVTKERTKFDLTHSRNTVEKVRQQLHRDHQRRTGEIDYWPPRSSLPDLIKPLPVDSEEAAKQAAIKSQPPGLRGSEYQIQNAPLDLKHRFNEAMERQRQLREIEDAARAKAEPIPEIDLNVED